MNQQIDVLPSASRTVTASAKLNNPDSASIHVILDMTTVGTGSVTLSIYGRDKISGKRYLLLAGAAVVTNVTNVYKVGPGLTAAANAVANDVVPKEVEIEVVANNANATVYSVGANFQL